MNLEFKNITKCNKQIYYQFLEFHNKKYGKKENFYMVCMFLGLIYITVFNIIHKNFSFLLCITFILIIFLLINSVRYRYKVVKKELKSPKVKNKEDLVYNFYEKYFEIIESNSSQKMKYYKLYKVHQDKNNFYFYIDKTHAFIIDKNGFIKGNIKEFKRFIARKCKIKFKKN